MVTRTERVRLELEDHFTTGMAKAAAAAALLDHNLNSLSGSAVGTNRDLDRTKQSVKGVGDEVDKTSARTRQGAKDIDRYGGRLRLLTEAAVALGPALIPIGAAGVPAVAGLAAGFGAAAGAAGVAILAFKGVGDALKSIDAYQLEPTTANLEKMRAELDKLGPAGADFARYLSSIEPELRSLQDAARAGMFPGVERGIDQLLTMLPQVRTIIFDVATGMGHLADEAGAALSGDRFSAFFDYLETDARPTVEAMGHTLGNLAEGLANLTVAFAPLTRDFSSGMESMSRSFADWAAGLSQTEGFRDFVEYVRESGPRVIDLLGALGEAFVGIIRSAAPVGEALIPMLTALANVLGAVANSPIGPPLYSAVAAMLVLNRVTSLTTKGMDAFGLSSATAAAASSRLATAAKGAGIALASMAIVDSLQRQFEGLDTGLEGVTRQLLDLSDAGAGAKLSGDFNDLADSFDRLTDPNIAQALQDNIYDTFGFLGSDSRVDKAKAQIEAIDAALTNVASTQGAERAGAAFKALAESLGLTTSEQAELLDMLPQYRDALAGAHNAARAAAQSTKGLGQNAGRTATEVRGLVSAMEEQTSAALGAFDAVTRYARALDAAQKRAKESSAGIGTNTEEQRKNRDSLSQLAAAWNNQGAAVRDNLGKWAQARQALITTAERMGATRQRAQELADELLDIPKFIAVRVDAYTDKAKHQIRDILTELQSIPRTISTDYFVNQVNAISRPRGPVENADGGVVPKTGLPYADRHLYLLADGERITSNRYGQADRYASALDAINRNLSPSAIRGRLADGGTVGGRRSIEDQLEIAQIMQQIRDLQRSLRKDGKDKLEGLNRRIAELQLKAAEKELRLAEHREEIERRTALRDAAAGLSFDSLLPSEPQTVAQGVRAQINTFKQQVLDAGGVWSKELRAWAKDMAATAREYDATTAAIEAETEKRAQLVDTLNEQQSQLDDLNRTMEAFGVRVASNFLNDPFNQSRTITISGDPAAVAALAQAQAQLAAVQATSGPSSAAQASRLMQQIALLQGPAASTEQTLTGLDAFGNVLTTDTANIQAFAAALQAAVARGLDPTGGLYAELAAKGDLTTAQQLAGLSPAEIDQFEALFKAREDAAAQLAAMTTQAVYGEQQAALQAQIDAQNQLIHAVDVTLTLLQATEAVLGEQVRAGAEAGSALLQPQLANINATLAGLPDATARALRHLIRQGGK